MTFIVNQDDVVYEKDLGPKTAKAASAMTTAPLGSYVDACRIDALTSDRVRSRFQLLHTVCHVFPRQGLIPATAIASDTWRFEPGSDPDALPASIAERLSAGRDSP